MKRIIRFMSLSLVLIICGLCLYAELSFHDISSDVVRLHVLANSNTQEDQALKLKVRDSVLEQAQILLADVSTKEESMKILSKNTTLLEKAALECIIREGYDYTVRVCLGKYDFPTKSYKNISLPQGNYDALRVIIGSGKGDNWWCVVFPPFCLGEPATDEKEDVSVRFRIVEIYNGIKKKIKSLW